MNPAARKAMVRAHYVETYALKATDALRLALGVLHDNDEHIPAAVQFARAIENINKGLEELR